LRSPMQSPLFPVFTMAIFPWRCHAQIPFWRVLAVPWGPTFWSVADFFSNPPLLFFSNIKPLQFLKRSSLLLLWGTLPLFPFRFFFCSTHPLDSRVRGVHNFGLSFCWTLFFMPFFPPFFLSKTFFFSQNPLFPFFFAIFFFPFPPPFSDLIRAPLAFGLGPLLFSPDFPDGLVLSFF